MVPNPQQQIASQRPVIFLALVFLVLGLTGALAGLWAVFFISLSWAVFCLVAARRFCQQDRQWVENQIHNPEPTIDLLESKQAECLWSDFLSKKSRSDF